MKVLAAWRERFTNTSAVAREWMQHHARRLKRGAVGCLALALLMSVVMMDLSGLRPSWPIESVGVSGDLRQVSRTELKSVLAVAVTTDFFDVDVFALRDAALSLPWVKQVTVRRVWPDHIDMFVLEQEVAARWEKGGLISVTGELFRPQHARGLDLFPTLNGPDGDERAVLERYRELRVELQALERRIVRVSVDGRGNWTVALDGDLELVLGSEVSHLQATARSLRRALDKRLVHVSRIDLRYPNGFAVRWKKVTTDLALQSHSAAALVGAVQ